MKCHACTLVCVKIQRDFNQLPGILTKSYSLNINFIKIFLGILERKMKDFSCRIQSVFALTTN
jgi:hypothetical protein